jgi:predicted AAA+ superfamily ATPase
MIPRHLQPELQTQLNEYPIVTILGPRQSGKTTLVKAVLPDYQYVNLENPETRQFATDDPKAFLRQYSDRTIFDEIQRAPHLLSYLQEIVDQRKVNGQFVLTGSHQLLLREAVTQSLASKGVQPTQIEAISFGEEKPQVEGTSEAAFSKNRRAELVYP